jgi:hypothetical protein
VEQLAIRAGSDTPRERRLSETGEQLANDPRDRIAASSPGRVRRRTMDDFERLSADPRLAKASLRDSTSVCIALCFGSGLLLLP